VTFNLRLTALAAATLFLTGCAAPQLQRQVDDTVGSVQPRLVSSTSPLPVDQTTLGSAPLAEKLAKQQSEPSVARRATRAWYGARMVAVQSDDQLPPVFTERYDFTFDDRATNGQVSLAVIAERIFRVTNVPVRVASDVYARVAASPAPAAPAPIVQMPLPGSSANRPGAAGSMPQPVPLNVLAAAGGSGVPTPQAASNMPTTQLPVTEINAIDVRWKNNDIVSLLNQVTDRLGLTWAYRDGVVTIQRYMTESFELASIVATQDFTMNMSGAQSGAAGGSGGATGSSASQMSLTETGKTDAINTFVKTLNGVLAGVPGSSVALNDGSARVTVTTTKDAMRQVREIVKQEVDSMTRQVMIQIDIYSMTRNVNQESGVDLSLVFRNLQNTFGVTLAGPASIASAQAGAVAINVLSSTTGGRPSSELVQQLGNSSLMVKALHQNGVSVQHQPLSLIAMNRQWARKTNLTQKGYLSETTPSTVAGAGSGAPGLKTASVTTGDRYMVQPAVLDNGSIMLKFGISLTNLLGLFDVTAGAGATLQKVQTPEVSGTDDQSTVLLKAGQVMMLTGLSRNKASTDGRSLAEGMPNGIGGSSAARVTREDFVIFIRPVIL
jgi:type IVB pilus formation R64 PilN family outer membrane protein